MVYTPARFPGPIAHQVLILVCNLIYAFFLQNVPWITFYYNNCCTVAFIFTACLYSNFSSDYLHYLTVKSINSFSTIAVGFHLINLYTFNINLNDHMHKFPNTWKYTFLTLTKMQLRKTLNWPIPDIRHCTNRPPSASIARPNAVEK